jgi:S1-C subfamily serine protease
VNYRWNTSRIGLYATLGIVDNILLGPSYVARKYSASVPAVFVRKGDDEYTGTGFFTSMVGDGAKSVIVTAKYNVDPGENISFMRLGDAGGCKFNPVNGNWVLHPKLDLALLEVYCHGTAPAPIFPLGHPSVLSRTITLGYPAIATTDSAYLLAHGGELNAIVNTYYGEVRLIISNVVGPGNSGGPVLDEAGLCLGMVVSSFETRHEGGTEKANSAIPAREIFDFMGPYCR